MLDVRGAGGGHDLGGPRTLLPLVRQKPTRTQMGYKEHGALGPCAPLPGLARKPLERRKEWTFDPELTDRLGQRTQQPSDPVILKTWNCDSSKKKKKKQRELCLCAGSGGHWLRLLSRGSLYYARHPSAAF